MEALVSRTIVKLLVEQSRSSTRLIYIDHRRAIEFFKRSTRLFHFSVNFLAVNASTTTKNFLRLREQWRTVKQEDDFHYLVLN